MRRPAVQKKKKKAVKSPPVTAYEDLWSAFKAFEEPGDAQLERLLEGLLALPPDPTPWGVVFNLFCTHGHPDLVAVYRRMAAKVPDTAAGGKSMLYWFAMRRFEREKPAMMAEIAADFAKLDGEDAYEPDVLQDIEDWLSAAHCDSEALQLAEHFLPAIRRDIERGAVPAAAEIHTGELIFQLRVGQALRAPGAKAGGSPEQLAHALRRDIEGVIPAELARRAAVLSTDRAPRPAWIHEDFRLADRQGEVSEGADQDSLRQHESLICLAREMWHEEQLAPGSTYRGLYLLLRTAQQFRDEEDSPDTHLLDCLRTDSLEERLYYGCPGVLGASGPKAALLVEMHEVLLRFARRHALIAGSQDALEQELARLRTEILQ